MRLFILLALLAAAPAAHAADIGSNTVRGVRLGMKLDNIRRIALSATWRYEPALVDGFSGDCVMDGETRLYCALTAKAETRDPEATVAAIIVFSDRFSAEDGVRVGMEIVEVERRWGDATFRMEGADLIRVAGENDLREIARFAGGPEGVRLRAVSPTLGVEADVSPAALYAKRDSDADAKESKVFRSDAKVKWIWVGPTSLDKAVGAKDAENGAKAEDGATDDGATDDGATDGGATDGGSTNDGASD